jgi:antitoxin Xre/MbcA/ParS-like protein
LEPEGRARLEEALAQKYLAWADDKVPALGGKTPRQMMKTAAGRAEVEKMVNEWENLSPSGTQAQFRFDFNLLRTDLGLAEE